MENAEDLLRKYFAQEKIPFSKILRSEVRGEKTPDFEAYVSGKKVLIEVKSFEYGESDAPFNRGSGFYTAHYPPGMKKIRRNLQDCSDQFKGYQNEITMCVLCNAKSILIDLDTPIVGMAMFGDINIRLPARDNDPILEYGKNGPSQISRREERSLISAVAVLEFKESCWRLRIIHNPYTRTPLPMKIFNGRFDEE